MSNFRTSNNRFGILIFNVLIFLMSLLVVITYATTPFFRTEATIALQKEDLINLVPSETYPDADLESALSDENINVAFTLEVSAATLFDVSKNMLHSLLHKGTLNVDVSETATEFVSSNVNGIVDQLITVVESSIKEIAKSVALKQAKSVLFNAINSTDTAAVETELASYGYNDEYFETKMDAVVNLFAEDDVTATQISQKAVDVLNEVVTEIKTDDRISNEALRTFNFTETNENTLKTNIENGLAAITDDGKISVALLKEDFAAQVMKTLPEGINETFGTILKISAGLLIFSMFTWIYLMIKIVCKWFAQNNSVKIKLPMWLGAIPGLLLWLLPVLTFYLIKNNPSALISLIPTAAKIAETVTISFYASGWLAVMASIILMICAIPYCTMRKPLKRRKLK